MKYTSIVIALCLCCVTTAFSQNADMSGKWKIVNEKSSFLDYYQEMTMEISVNNNKTEVITRMGPKRKYEEKLIFSTDGKINHCEITDGTFSTNIHMGLRLPVGTQKEITANWEKDQSLKMVEKYDFFASQGKKRGEMVYQYKLSPDKGTLTLTITRPTRQNDQGLKFIFKRYSKSAYLYKMTNDWDINSRLPEQACWISIQGIVNEKKPQLYFTFEQGYPFNYTEELAGYLETEKNFSFTKLTQLSAALKIFKDEIKGYIIWDKNVRTSLIVAYTLAGLEHSIVITEEMISVVRQEGLKEIADLRKKFEGKTDFEIYSWAKDQYWSRCSRDVIVWLGGVYGTTLMPACADYGMMKKGFFSDLSARPTDTEEFGLTNSLFAEMNPLGQVWGWHSYKKDLEEQMTTLLSSYALTSDGLNTEPNVSFLIHIPVSEGFTFKKQSQYRAGKKLYSGEKNISVIYSIRWNWNWRLVKTWQRFYAVCMGSHYEIIDSFACFTGILLQAGNSK